jgi:hypothetical protein
VKKDDQTARRAGMGFQPRPVDCVLSHGGIIAGRLSLT